jgi:hypothetical protein
VKDSRARAIVRSLSARLCGTAGVRRRRSEILSFAECSKAHGELSVEPAPLAIELGAEPWRPRGARESSLAAELRAALDHDAILDLIVYGSQARGGLTPFSDVDALLVLADETADTATVLRSLRPRILAAQRAVLAYQPMQHHGFQVVTPRLLRTAGTALGMPAVALAETRSVIGERVPAWFAEADQLGDPRPLQRVVGALTEISSWPTHPWTLHRTVSMFELVPALYLQARGEAVPKAESFAVARKEFGRSWWPYDWLYEVRQQWPAIKRPWLRRASRLLRNPWLAVAGWRRLPDNTDDGLQRALDRESLKALKGLTATMEARTR